jgi:hypothetical protein
LSALDQHSQTTLNNQTISTHIQHLSSPLQISQSHIKYYVYDGPFSLLSYSTTHHSISLYKSPASPKNTATKPPIGATTIPAKPVELAVAAAAVPVAEPAAVMPVALPVAAAVSSVVERCDIVAAAAEEEENSLIAHHINIAPYRITKSRSGNSGNGGLRSCSSAERRNLILHRRLFRDTRAVVIARQQVGVLRAQAHPVVAAAGLDLGLDACDTGIDDARALLALRLEGRGMNGGLVSGTYFCASHFPVAAGTAEEVAV